MDEQRPRPWEEDESTESDGEREMFFLCSLTDRQETRHSGSSEATSKEDDEACAPESELNRDVMDPYLLEFCG